MQDGQANDHAAALVNGATNAAEAVQGDKGSSRPVQQQHPTCTSAEQGNVVEPGTWQAIARSKQHEREQKLQAWPQARLRQLPATVRKLPAWQMIEAGNVLSSEELYITRQLSATALAKLIAKRQFSAVQTVTAFIKAAVLAQDATNCLTEICFEQALERAKELDETLESTGKTVGPLHGIPISVKDHIDVTGMDSASGLACWCYKRVAEKDAVVVRCLCQAGAIVFCKTANPQTLLAIETHNNIYGRTVNPYNARLSAGGSTGGEGALIGMGGSILGIGTDIAGSIRIPALWNGCYGLKPSTGRLPHTGLQGPHAGMDAITGACGPLSAHAEDLSLFCSVILGQRPWDLEAQTIRLPWLPLPHPTGTERLTFAVMRDDGICAPHPPITAALDKVVCGLLKMGHRIVEWTPLRPKESEDLLVSFLTAAPAVQLWHFRLLTVGLQFSLLLQDRGAEYWQLLQVSGEPAVTQIEWLLEHRAPIRSLGMPSDLWALVRKRESLRQDAVEQWNALAIDGQLDAILCPGAATLAPRHDQSRHWGYTSMWNILDWPAVTFPVDMQAIDGSNANDEKAWPPHPPRNETEAHVFAEWDLASDPHRYRDAPIGLQLVGRKLQEEKLLRDLDVVQMAKSG